MAQDLVLAISGPTGSGKSDLALFLAEHLSGEIVNIDSVQVYRNFDIGSAKPSIQERSTLPHHLFDVADPSSALNAARFGELAHAAILSIKSRNKLPILVGGSGMYTTTLFHGLANIPGRDQALREELGKLSNEDLHQRLVEVDPERASKLHLRDRLRAIRAIESFKLSGQKQSDVLEDHGFGEQCLKGLFIIPIWPRPELYRRIDERSHKMIAQGLVEEVNSIVSKYGADIQPLRSLGYAQVLEKREEERDEEALAVDISLHTRRFAKRQMTFWRNEPKKRGWAVSPKQDGAVVKPTGRRAKLAQVEFCTLSLTRDELLGALKKRLSEPMDVSEVWYVDASAMRGTASLRGCP